MLKTTRSLFEELNSSGIRYCHWKSNWALEETLSGMTDIDLLVSRSDAAAFHQILGRVGFAPAVDRRLLPLPGVEHHFALDQESGVIAHVHAYYRVMTGESLAKNYRLPLEEMLLRNTRQVGIVSIPSPGAELIVFVVRMMLKHTTLTELLLLARDRSNATREASWLFTERALDEAEGLLGAWLPNFDEKMFREAARSLSRPSSIWRRIVLGRRVRANLRGFARSGRFRASLRGIGGLVRMAYRRFRRSGRSRALAGGGAVIAVVGSEATGKSTLLNELDRTFSKHLATKRIHAGKPPSTLLTVAPNLFLPLLRRLLPGRHVARTGAAGEGRDENSGREGSLRLPFIIRSALLAHDRRKLLSNAHSEAANGSIVLCDRYPSSRGGAPDSPQLGEVMTRPGSSRVHRWFATQEARHYGAIPPPDLVIFLTAPLDVTLKRNAIRGKTEPEAYVRERHARSSAIQFDRIPTHRIDTDQPLADTVRQAQGIIWDTLWPRA
jgi:thymidylate kinase